MSLHLEELFDNNRSWAAATEVLIAHNVGSEEEVRQVLAQAQAAGGRLIKPAQPTFWGGFGGYFQDLDGHVWEVVFNPHLQALD